MNDSENPPTPSNKTQRNVFVFACALAGFCLAVLAIVGLPLQDEVGVGLAYLAVFIVAAAGITLIFRVFVKRR